MVELNMSKIGALSVIKYISVRKIEQGHTEEKKSQVDVKSKNCRIVRREGYFSIRGAHRKLHGVVVLAWKFSYTHFFSFSHSTGI